LKMKKEDYADNVWAVLQAKQQKLLDKMMKDME
jgi:hypothetical protein